MRMHCLNRKPVKDIIVEIHDGEEENRSISCKTQRERGDEYPMRHILET